MNSGGSPPQDSLAFHIWLPSPGIFAHGTRGSSEQSQPPPHQVQASLGGNIARMNSGGGLSSGGAVFPHCPSIKGVCAQEAPSHLGLLLTQCGSERQTNGPVCAGLRCGGSAAGPEVLMGLLPSQPGPAPPGSPLLPGPSTLHIPGCRSVLL